MSDFVLCRYNAMTMGMYGLLSTFCLGAAIYYYSGHTALSDLSISLFVRFCAYRHATEANHR